MNIPAMNNPPSTTFRTGYIYFTELNYLVNCRIGWVSFSSRFTLDYTNQSTPLPPAPYPAPAITTVPSAASSAPPSAHNPNDHPSDKSQW